MIMGALIVTKKLNLAARPCNSAEIYCKSPHPVDCIWRHRYASSCPFYRPLASRV